MADDVLVDAGFLVALLSRRDEHHRWASTKAKEFPPPWRTCESVLSEAAHLLGPRGADSLAELLRRRAVRVEFGFNEHVDRILALLEKYHDVPASLADAVLVRMTEVVDTPMLLTTDGDFHVYRRLGRQVVPVQTP
jgi:uncharacterized protein